ncbi:MAG TPA: imidazolonepropionase [bacterium]|jgi:imidazolonepropionase
MADVLIRNIGLLASPRFADRDETLRSVVKIQGAAILIQDGRIADAGPEADVLRRVPQGIPHYDAKGCLALPGLIDCHTHPVFVGNRAAEFHLRNAGKTYLEIAAAGGGIQASARKVQAAPVEQIVAESLPRFHRSLACGVTTIEAKSGYGLDWTGELKLLDALTEIKRRIPQRMHRTFLIHALPSSYANRRAEFCDEVVTRMIPAVAAGKLAAWVDVFCETGAFTVEESRRFLLAAREHGLGCMVHANQFGHSGGALLAAEIGARSAHHLEYLNDAEMDAMAAAGVVAVALPASVFFLGNLPYPSVRTMIAHRMRVAVASDMNPGSSMTESLPFCLTAAAVYCKMTPEELLWSVTLDAARVLDADHDVGSLEVGRHGDVSLWNIPDLESLSYHFGDMRAAAVLMSGDLVWENCDATRHY